MQKCHGRSTEEEAREIRRNALRVDETDKVGIGTQIADLFGGIGLDEDIPELRCHIIIMPAVFEP